jgi:hypothetical protein
VGDVSLDVLPVREPRAPPEPAAARLGMANGRVAVCELSAEREGRPAAARREKGGPPPAREQVAGKLI